MRRSLDFGTFTGSLSTLKSSRSNGNSDVDGATTSPSPNGSRYGTIAGIPFSEAGSAVNDRFQRPKSALGNGTGRAGRRAFALGTLFNVGQQDDSQDHTKDKQEVIHHSQSVAALPSSNSNASSHDPRTPDTSDEREHALMHAVQAAKARDEAWEITVQLAPSEGLFLDLGSSRRNKLERGPRSDYKKASSSPNIIFGGLSGRARRFLGRERVTTASATALSTTAEEDARVNADPTEDPSVARPSPPMTPAVATTPRRASKTGLGETTPASPAKRPLESSQDDISLSPNATTFSGDRVLDSHPPSTSTPAFNIGTLSPDIQAHPDPLLVLYVTTGSSSLTLYRKIGQLTKLDDEFRKHFMAHMPIAPRPSILSLSPVKTSARDMRGHARRKSVLASLTRTFTSPTITRKGTPSILSSASRASIAEEDTGHLEAPLSHQASLSFVKAPSTLNEQELNNSVANGFPNSILQSQLSNLSDYLTSLSCIADIRASKQWTTFFRAGKEDHESSRLESPPPSQSTISKGKRLKRMKSDTAVETRSPKTTSSHSSVLHHGPNTDSHGKSTEVTPTRKEVRIEDSGIGVDSLGHYSARNSSALGRGHPTESSTNSSSTTSNSASMQMKRDASTDTDTSVSAMSLFIEHADANGKEIVGDPEVLEYMQRLRQDSEARHASASDPFKSTTNKLKQEAKSSKSTIMEYVPPSPVSPMSPSGEDVAATPPATLSDSLIVDTSISSVNSPSDEPILAALEDSMIDATPFVENENHLPPLSGATAVASEEEHVHEAEPLQVQESLSPSFLSPTSAATDDLEAHSRLSSLNGKKKKSVSSLRRSRKSSAANTSFSHRTRSHKPSIRIEDFEILRVLGKGCAGKVLLARLKDATTMSTASGDNSLYAVKAIHKHHVLAHRELAHTLTEQNILRKMATETPNPFVVKMRWSFQDNDNLFLVLDFHPGGDLATQLSRWGRLGKDRTRFYAAEIIEGLESLHNSGVIYRDLKPENILLAADGHIVLTDFGLSKQFYRPSGDLDGTGNHNGVILPSWSSKERINSGSRQTPLTSAGTAEMTTTFCGTAEYLAPEVLLGHAYSYPVDMWSLGTMIYEMLLGVTPFYNEDHGIMYRRVLHEQLEFGPSDYLDSDTRALLRGLLQKEPEFRMTTSRVKRSKYFEAIDWSFVNNKRYIPPFIPHLSPDDPADTQNFEECFLTMDLGFVDDKDTEEIEIKAKTSGKEPDKPFDEDGRDVFADYSFDGAWADPDSEKEDQESDDDIGEEEDSEAPEEEVAQENKASSKTVEAPDHLQNGQIAQLPAKQCNVEKTSTPPLSAGRHENEVKEGMENSSPELVPVEASQISQNGQATQPILKLPEAGELSVENEGREEQTNNDARLSGEASLRCSTRPGLRSSVEMPRMASPAQMSGEDDIRVSEDHGDWDVVEDLGSHEVADNGTKGTRKRLLAGTNLFAKGVVDKYKMQLKPLSRMPTPTRSYTARSPLTRLASGSAQPTRSNKTSNQLSPSPSIGGMSDSPSSMESSEQVDRQEKRPTKGPTRRLISPRLLRASSDWMSNSLPSSPTPKFYMRRNKKGTGGPEGVTPLSEDVQLPPLRESAPDAPSASSNDSSATIPVENAGTLGLQPLTRHATREQSSPVNDAFSTGAEASFSGAGQ